MKQNTISTREAKKRKILLLLPLISLPLITIFFYILGGGRLQGISTENKTGKGFNFSLPAPQFKEDSALDKMSYYDRAATDSLRFLEQIKKDPNYNTENMPAAPLAGFAHTDPAAPGLPKGRAAFNLSSFQNKNEQKVYEKLRALQRAISEPLPSGNYPQDMREFENYGSSKGQSDQVNELESIMSRMGESPQADPELKELGGMLENILDIQHPSRVEERLKQSTDRKKGKTFTVIPSTEKDNTTSLGENNVLSPEKINAFYTEHQGVEAQEQPNSIQAVIHQTQSLVNGSVVKLRLQSEVVLKGTVIPKNTFLYGTASLKGERLEIKINNIQFRNSIFPVELTVYDLDGIEGIYIPGAINRDVAKASADRSIQSMGLSGFADSFGAQAAGMGIEAAKSLMSKKVTLIKVVVLAGYQVLLYDEKQKIPNN